MTDAQSIFAAWKGKSVFLTGGTGSFGMRFAETLISRRLPKRLVIFSRDELKQDMMRQTHRTVRGVNVQYVLGDVRDYAQLRDAMRQIDVVVHAAAMKQIPACESNPLEAVKTNILGAQNVIRAAVANNVRSVLALSTDKAVNPVNLYGATKLVAERLFVAANEGTTKFSCVRYGNVMGSRGSVVPRFLEQRSQGRITITDERMTRFCLTLNQGVHVVLTCLSRMRGGEIFVPKVPSVRIVDLAAAVAPGCEIDMIGARPGEKIHERLLSEDESRHTVELPDMYVVKREGEASDSGWETANPVAPTLAYCSDAPLLWLNQSQISALLNESSGKPGETGHEDYLGATA